MAKWKQEAWNTSMNLCVCVCVCVCARVCSHERSVIETRQSKATMPEDNSKRKRRAASGGTQTHDILHTRQTLYQLSH